MHELKMLSVEREEKILAYLMKHGKGSVQELSRTLDISEITIRRDLGRLSSRYPIQRIYGGAVLERAIPLEPPVLQRRDLFAEEKRRIGQAAADFIQDGETIMLLGGSTTLEIVGHLKNQKDITIITDSMLIAEKAAMLQDTRCILLGGSVRPAELTMEGPLAQLCLKELRAHKMFIGARAINFAQGIMLNEVSEVTLVRDGIRMASEVILVVDHSKFSQVATAVLGPSTIVQRIVTDSAVAPEIPVRLRELGIEVTIV
jgi:DeoR/GlpR family transcriptional regulator of sugar metabolism